MRKPSVFLAALGLFLAAGWAWAQGTTSAVTGTVTSDGKPLPDVTVTVSSPSLQGTRKTTTGPNGVYNFGALPPGDYTITFEHEGLQTVTRKQRLLLAETSRADADLAVSNVKEEVRVSGQPVAAAVFETTQIASNLTSQELSKLPVARTIRGAVLVMPGVSPNGVNNQITISGAPSYDNLFLVDGVVVGENLRGQPDNLFIEDAIQEITTLSGGISAEYGRFTGGVVSTLTKSGSNEFHGSFRDSLSNPKWTARLHGRPRRTTWTRPTASTRRPSEAGSFPTTSGSSAAAAWPSATYSDSRPSPTSRSTTASTKNATKGS